MTRCAFLGVLCAFVLAAWSASAAGVPAAAPRRFVFGATPDTAGALRVDATHRYTPERGYGFDNETQPGDGPGPAKPFYFSVALPEGNYRVTATLGSPVRDTDTTVKAEARRLMLESVRATAGKPEIHSFTVNIRTPALSNGQSVRLKKRESGPPMAPHWDEKLTLEFNGPQPGLLALEIATAPETVTVILAGDSTVTDQSLEPWNSWGQMLPRFFGPGAAIANHAESGESLKSFASARRSDKILDAMKPGDYLLIQFGHNDQKDRAPGAGAFTTYKSALARLISGARARGGLPVVVTSMHRLRFDATGRVPNTLGDFPEAARQAAREAGVPLIDLHAMSKTLYEALGPVQCPKAFQDGTHHNNYGSYELAKCVVEGIKTQVPALARLLAPGLTPFNPAHPDAPATFNVPPSPGRTTLKPEGN